MSHQVFICHASEDKPIADAVCAVLEENRIPCWIAPRDILPADDYGQAIVESICSSHMVVFVFSTNANASPHIRRELECAVSHGIPILPFRIEDAIPSESLQYYLGGIHWLDALTPPLETHLHHLAGTVKVLLERDDNAPSGGLPPPVPPVTPPRETSPVKPPGNRRRAMLVGLGVAVVIALGIGIATALIGGDGGDSGGDSEPVPTDVNTDTEVGSTAAGQRACELLDPSDVSAVYGPDADTGTPNEDFCDFGFYEAVTVFEGMTRMDFDANKELATAGSEDVPNLGDGAFQEPDGTLWVFDEDRAMVFLLITGGSEPVDYQQLVDLATLMLARG